MLTTLFQAWWTPIHKLTYWKGGSWVRCDDSKGCSMALRIHYDQILITNNNKVIESLNMNSKINGIYKGDVLILIVCKTSQEVRKLKFQIKSNAIQCFQQLGEHFPVCCHKSTPRNDPMKYRNIEEVFKSVLDQYGSSSTIQLPPNYKEFVKVCLLDPTFPQVINETQEFIKSEILSNKD